MSNTVTDAALPVETTGAGADVVHIPQYSGARVLGVWALATLPMGLGAWVVAPALESRWNDDTGLLRPLMLTLFVGLVWQALVVAVTLYREQGTLRWSVLRNALWLRTPYDPRRAKRSPRLWLMLIPVILVVGAVEEFVPRAAGPDARNLFLALQSDAGQAFFSGNWSWFWLVVIMQLFNTVLGEEMLFRGLLLPRMQTAFGKGAWFVNAVLFGLYHVHLWWTLPNQILSGMVFAYPPQRYRTAWFGIITHSMQSIVVTGILLTLVLN